MDTTKQKILTVFSKQPILASFATITEDNRPWVRYVMIIMDAYDLTIRFSTFINARKVAHIEKHPEIHLTCGCTDSVTVPTTYLQIQGRANLTTDIADKKLVWHKHLEECFRDINNPDFGVIRVIPYRIEVCSHDAKVIVWEKKEFTKR